MGFRVRRPTNTHRRLKGRTDRIASGPKSSNCNPPALWVFWHAGFMTEPPFSGNEGGNRYPPPGPHEGYGPPGPQYLPPAGEYPPPPGRYPSPTGGYPTAYTDPAAPWGRHPVTGEPFSDKSKVVAGLLQLLGLLGLVGIGRIYLGDTKSGHHPARRRTAHLHGRRDHLGDRRRDPHPHRQGA